MGQKAERQDPKMVIDSVADLAKMKDWTIKDVYLIGNPSQLRIKLKNILQEEITILIAPFFRAEQKGTMLNVIQSLIIESIKPSPKLLKGKH